MRVYVSSTVQDLREHRSAAIRVLRQMGHEVVAMEDYVAESAVPVEKVIADVAGCDVYVGIFAWRYGYVPVRGPRLKGVRPGKTSVTEYEYRQAAATDGVEVLVYLLDEQAPWPAAQIDGVRDPIHGESIRALRAHLQSERMVGYFTSPDGLAAQVGAGVSALGMKRSVKRRLLTPLSSSTVASALGYPGPRTVAPRYLNDSYLMPLKEMLTGSTTAEAATIDISTTWWSTRLYLLAALGQVVGGLRAIVVLDAGAFVGVASTTSIRRALRSEHRHADRYERTVLSQPPAGDISQTLDRYLLGWNRIMGAHGSPGDETGQEPSVQTPVTRQNLQLWLGEALATSAVVVEEMDALSAVDLLRVLDYPRDLVPIMASRQRRPAATDLRAEPASRAAGPSTVWLIDKAQVGQQLARQSLQELLDRLRVV